MGIKRVIYLGIVVVTMYTIITVYFFQSYIKDRKHSRPTPPMKLLVLVSQPRSGSTYLGNVISKSLQSIYFYEPLYKLDRLLGIDKNYNADEKKEDKYNHIATQYLQNIFKCSFKQKTEWEQIIQSPFKDQSTLQGNECSKQQTKQQQTKQKKEKKGYMLNRCMPYFDRNHLEQDCQKFNLMVKLLEMRLPKNNILNLHYQIDDQTAYKILYLIRDPRASFWSLLNLGWVAQTMDDNYKKYIESRCDEMYQNIKRIKQQDNFIIVRYEDLLTRPQKALSELLQFVDREAAQRILSQLNRNQCYVPKFNNKYNKSIINHGHLSRLLLHVSRLKSKAKEKEKGIENDDEDIDYKVVREKEKMNYQCFTINKWRYVVNKKYVHIIEKKCSKLMNLMGYELLGKDVHLIQDIEHSVIKHEIDLE